MTEQLSLQLSAEEASRRIVADVRAYPYKGPDKRKEHLRLFGELIAREEIEALWADRYTEIALAGRDKLANLTGRFEALRPKIKEVANDPNLGALFKKLVKPASEPTKSAPNYRRITSTNFHAPVSLSFILPSPQPTADEKGKDTARGLRPEV